MTRSNPWAARAIAERLLEAAERGMWASPEADTLDGHPRPLPRARGRARGGRRVSRPYPLTAIVGQESLVEALLINAVSPEVGGVLVRGERGTAKSTAVRGLASLLPPVTRRERARRSRSRPGELAPDGPVAAEQRGRAARRRRSSSCRSARASTGSSARSTSAARSTARRPSRPGLLARAHQGILYVDEVNLLPDHLVDALLDAAASGVSRVERDAVSAVHDARFLLVGTMNVEEGELRPQLLDRFGLGVEVTGPPEPDVRAEIVRRRLAFERDAEALRARVGRRPRTSSRARIAAARERLPRVRLPERELLRITAACASLGVDGVRGDIVTRARGARAGRARRACDEVEEEHVRSARGALALLHRRRRDPLDGRTPSPDDIERALDDEPPPEPPSGRSAARRRPAAPIRRPPRAARRRRRASAATRPARARLPAEALRIAGTGSGPGGRRARSSGAGAGAIDCRPAADDSDDVSIVATLRARLVAGRRRGPARARARRPRERAAVPGRGRQRIDGRAPAPGARQGRAAGARCARPTSAAIASPSIAFRGSDAQRARAARRAARGRRRGHPASCRPAAARRSRQGSALAEQVIRREAGRERGRRTIAVILTDGRVEDPTGEVRRAAARLGRAADAAHVIDIEDGPVRLGLAARARARPRARACTSLTDPPAMPRTAA